MAQRATDNLKGARRKLNLGFIFRLAFISWFTVGRSKVKKPTLEEENLRAGLLYRCSIDFP